MAKVTIEFDEGGGVKVDAPAAPSDPAPAGNAMDGGAAPAEDGQSDATASAPFDRSASDTHDAGGPPDWLHEALAAASESPDAPPVSGDAPIDGGAAPEE